MTEEKKAQEPTRKPTLAELHYLALGRDPKDVYKRYDTDETDNDGHWEYDSDGGNDLPGEVYD